jgi:alcohol dehydrogenase (cytochrome c)
VIRRFQRMLLACAAASLVATGLAQYSSVTADRLVNPEPENWLHYRGTYDGWGYSPLDQIDASNVASLRPVWSFATGVTEGHQAPPIVNDGIMYVTTPQNQVIALDAVSGDLLWRYRRQLPPETTMVHPTNRGVGLWEDSLFLATLDAYVVALDATSGEVLWERELADTAAGYYMTLAPLVVDGVVMVGVSGGERGVRGFIEALDHETGDTVWKTFTIPGPGEPGNETWPGDTWERGGASIWITGVYDPEQNLSYWGTGNGAPWTGDTRPGDNLYATSVIAVDVESGDIVGHYQYQPNDSWDWDEVSAPFLLDVEYQGETIRAALNVARNGYIYLLDRTDGRLDFVDAVPYVYQNVYLGFEEDGRPIYDPDRVPGIGTVTEFCPSLWGGKDWPPAAYSPDTGMIYIPANENHCGAIEGLEVEYVPGSSYTGARTEFWITEDAEHIGELQAWDVNTMERVWTVEFESHNWGPVLATAGNLVFAGGTNDRYFRAFDATSGETLWEHRTNSGVTGVPSTFMVDGVQYIAVQAGWGVDAQRMQNRIAADLGWSADVPQGGTVWVYALQND